MTRLIAGDNTQHGTRGKETEGVETSLISSQSTADVSHTTINITSIDFIDNNFQKR